MPKKSRSNSILSNNRSPAKPSSSESAHYSKSYGDRSSPVFFNRMNQLSSEVLATDGNIEFPKLSEGIIEILHNLVYCLLENDAEKIYSAVIKIRKAYFEIPKLEQEKLHALKFKVNNWEEIWSFEKAFSILTNTKPNAKETVVFFMQLLTIYRPSTRFELQRTKQFDQQLAKFILHPKLQASATFAMVKQVQILTHALRDRSLSSKDKETQFFEFKNYLETLSVKECYQLYIHQLCMNDSNHKLSFEEAYLRLQKDLSDDEGVRFLTRFLFNYWAGAIDFSDDLDNKPPKEDWEPWIFAEFRSLKEDEAKRGLKWLLVQLSQYKALSGIKKDAHEMYLRVKKEDKPNYKFWFANFIGTYVMEVIYREKDNKSLSEEVKLLENIYQASLSADTFGGNDLDDSPACSSRDCRPRQTSKPASKKDNDKAEEYFENLFMFDHI